MTTKRQLCSLFVGVLGTVLAIGGNAHAIIGRPLTPMSYAGVARRTVRRSAYVGAAYGAYGAAAAPVVVAPPPTAVQVVPAGCTVGVPCGGAVYQPVYVGPQVMYVP